MKVAEPKEKHETPTNLNKTFKAKENTLKINELFIML